MARVTYGALITELTGSIGGITFQKNSSGNIARLKPNMPVNSSTNQQGQQIKLSQLVSSWSSLSAADKTSWNDLAAAHDHINEWDISKTLNGFQWYVSCNLNRLAMSLTVLDTAPAWTTVSALSDFVLTAGAASLLCTWSPAVDTTGYRVHFYVTPPLRQSSLLLRRSTFLIRKVDTNLLNTEDLKAFYEYFFNVTWADIYSDANCTVIVRAKLIQESTGLASPYTSQSIKIN